MGSMYVSGKLPTYPSPNLTFCLKREVSVNVRFLEGSVCSFPETYIDPIYLFIYLFVSYFLLSDFFFIRTVVSSFPWIVTVQQREEWIVTIMELC